MCRDLALVSYLEWVSYQYESFHNTFIPVSAFPEREHSSRCSWSSHDGLKRRIQLFLHIKCDSGSVHHLAPHFLEHHIFWRSAEAKQRQYLLCRAQSSHLLLCDPVEHQRNVWLNSNAKRSQRCDHHGFGIQSCGRNGHQAETIRYMSMICVRLVRGFSL